jgi:hypothetical protein
MAESLAHLLCIWWEVPGSNSAWSLAILPNHYSLIILPFDTTYEVWLLNNETVFIKNIVLKFMYVASYLLQSSSLGLLYSAACVPSMHGNISGNHFV